MVKPMIPESAIWQALDEVMDPELPAVSLVEMGIVREVNIDEAGVVRVTITPTFAGCPALHMMRDAISSRLAALGIAQVAVDITYQPPWSTNFIKDSAKTKLKAYGIAPAPIHSGDFELALTEAVHCPYCDSINTVLKNNFGPTPCRMIYYCNTCQQPFARFKPL